MDRKSKTNRRDFLRGRSLAREIHDQLDTPSPIHLDTISHSDENEVSRQQAYLQQFSKRAMACEFELLFNMQQYSNAGEAALSAFGIIDDLEGRLSIYREDSLISGINRDAVEGAIVLPDDLFDLLLRAKDISEHTAGAFDITAGPLTQLWGFEQREGRVPEPEQIKQTLSCVGSNRYLLNEESKAIRFLKRGVKINLGGIGKGFAIDRAADHLITNEINDFIIHGGQSSVKAYGSQNVKIDGEQQERQHWVVGLSHPMIPEQRVAEIFLSNEALGTSGSGRQGFYSDGQRYGHIIDPRSGWPTGHILSSTVVAPTAAEADALATAFFVMTVDEVLDFCNSNTSIKALLMMPSDRTGAIQILSINFADSDWRRLSD